MMYYKLNRGKKNHPTVSSFWANEQSVPERNNNNESFDNVKKSTAAIYPVFYYFKKVVFGILIFLGLFIPALIFHENGGSFDDDGDPKRGTVIPREHSVPNFHKPFVYLINTDEPMLHEGRGPIPSESRDVVFLCYSPACKNSTSDKYTVIVNPDTTWTTGRNYLLEYVLERSKLSGHLGYEYYVMLDDDVPSMLCENPIEMRHCSKIWDEWEAWLLDEKPAFGYISDISIAPDYPGWVDANLNAFHHSTLGLLLPYAAHLDDIGIFFSAYIQIIMRHYTVGCQSMKYPHKLQYQTNLGLHRAGTTKYKRNCDWTIPQRFLSDLFLDQPIVESMKAMIEVGSIYVQPSCCRDAYTSSPWHPLHRYGPVSRDWILAHFNKSNPQISTLLDFQYRHSGFLHLLRQHQTVVGQNSSTYGIEYRCP